MTLQELGEVLALTVADDDEWRRAAISLALDIGNDLGIAVPMTRYDEVRSLVYRCFRFGERATVANIPLGDARWSRHQYDDFTRRWRSGYPLRSSIEPLATYPEAVGRVTTRRKGRHGALKRLVSQALPGRLEERYEGVVLEFVQGETVVAHLRDPNDDEYGLARIPWEALWPEDAERVMEYSAVVWTIFRQEDDFGRILRSSRLRVVPDADPDPDLAEARTRRLAELLAE